MPDPGSIGAIDWTLGGILVVVLVAAIWVSRDYLKNQDRIRKAEMEWQHQLIGELRAERTADTEAYKELVGQMRQQQQTDTKTYVDLTHRLIETQQMTATALDGVCKGQEQMREKQDQYHSETLRAVGAE